MTSEKDEGRGAKDEVNLALRPSPFALRPFFPILAPQTKHTIPMAKSKDQKKDVKKVATKTKAEKRAEKRDKKPKYD